MGEKLDAGRDPIETAAPFQHSAAAERAHSTAEILAPGNRSCRQNYGCLTVWTLTPSISLQH